MDERRTYRLFRRTAIAHLPEADAAALIVSLRAAIRDRQPRASRWAVQQLGGREELSSEIWQAIGNVDRPYPDAEPALAQLRKSYRLAILGNQGLQTRARLEKAGLLRHCEAAIISDEVGLAKPDPRIFELALTALGVQPEEAAMVGDRLDLDIAPARRLGMRAIRMRRGPHVWQRPLDEQEQPDLTVRSLHELVQRLS